MFHNGDCACHWRGGGEIQTTDRTRRVLRRDMKTFFLPECQTALANTSGKSISKCVFAVLLGAMLWCEGGLADQSHDLRACVCCPHCHAALHCRPCEYQRLAPTRQSAMSTHTMGLRCRLSSEAVLSCLKHCRTMGYSSLRCPLFPRLSCSRELFYIPLLTSLPH